jgi:hypothetical protein
VRSPSSVVMSDCDTSSAFQQVAGAALAAAPRPYKMLFLIDGTASMTPWIEAVKSSITQLSYIKELTGLEITMQFIIFRDYTLRCVDAYGRLYCPPDSVSKRLETSPVYYNIAFAIAFLNSINVYGNTDNEEAVKTGLFNSLPHIDERTIMFVITDDLPHEDVDLTKLPLPRGFAKYRAALKYYRKIADNPTNNGTRNYAFVANKILEAAVLGDYARWQFLVAHEKFEILRQRQQLFVLTNKNSQEMVDTYTQLGLNIVLKNTNPTTISNVLIGIFMNLTNVAFASDYAVLDTFYVYGTVNTLPHMNMKNGLLYGNCYIPHVQQPKDSDSTGLLFHVIPDLEINLAGITARFKSDANFKQKVFSILDKVLTPEHVMCLTTSALWGKLWRECCKVKDYPPLYVLKDKLGGLAKNPRLLGLKKWIDDSYNYIHEVLEFFDESMTSYFASGSGKDYVILLVSTNPQLTRDEVLAISRGARNLKALMEFIKSIQLVEYWPDKDKMDTIPNSTGRTRVNKLPKNYVPYCLDTNKLFLYLPHLMCAGTLFSMFPACVFAILAFQSDNPVFNTRAARYLGNMFGRWIPIEEGKKNRELLAEFVNSRFVRLVRDFPQFFTEEEQRFFRPFMNHVIVSSLLNLEINVDLSWVPIKGNLYADHKFDCAHCEQSRSFTLMITPEKCALCLYPELSKLGDCNSTLKSYMVKCSNPECGCFYAVEHVKRLVSRPKCYPCRNGLAPQYTTCSRCKNRFITPCSVLTMLPEGGAVGSDETASSQWLCAMCIRCPTESISEVPLTLETILSEHSAMMPLLGLSPHTPLHLEGSLFKNMDSIHAVSDDAPALDPTAIAFADMQIIQRPAHHIPELFTQIRHQVEHGSHIKECCFCYEPTHISNLYPLCGACPNQVCKPCGERHYGVITPGNLVNPTQMHCPMCKRKPTRKVINSYNPHFRNLMGTAQHVFDPHSFYAWCIDCNRICQAGEMACTADGQMPDFRGDYKCDDCRAATAAILGAAASINAKNCPVCDVATEKAGGCNHITCPNRECRAHWCWICMAVFPYDQLHTGSDMDIYEHMTSAHGGWWGNDDAPEQGGAAEGYD